MAQSATDRAVETIALPEVRAIGRSIFDPMWAEKEHESWGAELVHVISGRVKVMTPGYEVAAEAGDTIYTPQGMPHRDVFPPGTTFEVYLLSFRWAGEPALLREVTPTQMTAAARGLRAQMGHAFGQLYAGLRTTGVGGSGQRVEASRVSQLRVLEIIHQLREAALEGGAEGQRSDVDTAARHRRIIADARTLIDQRFHQPISLDDLAEALDISPYHLSHVFSEEAGFTLSSYLLRVRMDHAAKLLGKTSMKVNDVAERVGYRDSRYFARVFKGYFGRTPSQFRTA